MKMSDPFFLSMDQKGCNMNKRTTRGFAFGIIFAVFVLTIFSYTKGALKEKTISTKEAKAILETKGYTVLNKDEYQRLNNTAKSAKQAMSKDNPTSKENPQNKPGKQEPTKITYILNISEGMSPEEIATLLEKDQIIKDRNKLEQYINSHQLSTKVQVGTYRLTNDMTFEEIAKIITKTNGASQ